MSLLHSRYAVLLKYPPLKHHGRRLTGSFAGSAASPTQQFSNSTRLSPTKPDPTKPLLARASLDIAHSFILRIRSYHHTVVLSLSFRCTRRRVLRLGRSSNSSEMILRPTPSTTTFEEDLLSADVEALIANCIRAVAVRMFETDVVAVCELLGENVICGQYSQRYRSLRAQRSSRGNSPSSMKTGLA